MAKASEIISHHSRLRSISPLAPSPYDRFDGGSWSMLYRCFLDLPSELDDVLLLLECLSLKPEYEEFLLGDILENGPSSTATFMIRECHRAMYPLDYYGTRVEWWRFCRRVLEWRDGGEFQGSHEEVGQMAGDQFPADLHHILSSIPIAKDDADVEVILRESMLALRGYMDEQLHETFTNYFESTVDLLETWIKRQIPGANQANTALGVELDRLFDGLIPWGESALSSLLKSMEFVTEDRLGDFVALADEYNGEWALACFDWGDGQEPTLIPTMERFVRDSPWSS